MSSAIYRVRPFPRPELERAFGAGWAHAKWLFNATMEVDEHVRITKRAWLRGSLKDSESRRLRRAWNIE